MNKKGFTLIEISIAVVLLVMLAVLVIPGLVKNDNKTKEKLYNAKINEALASSYKYGRENIDSLSSNCLDITIGTLINLGYLKGDDESGYKMLNPLNNESMNNTIICVRYVNGEVLTNVK